MFNIGDKVVYLQYGAGVIESIEEKEISGQKKKYYILKLVLNDLKVMIPIDSIGDFSIRRIVNYNDYCNIIDFMKDEIENDSIKASKKNRIYNEKLKKGDIYSIAYVVKDLWIKENKNILSSTEKKLLETSEQILLSELILVTGYGYNEIKEILKNKIY